VALVATQALGAVLSVLMVVVSGEAAPEPAALLWAAAAGASGLIGLAGLFLALSRGTMGLVAPLTAVIAATVPALVGVFSGDQMEPPTMLGMLLALVAVVAVAMPDRAGTPRDLTASRSRSGRLAEWGLVLSAGLGFAGYFLGVDQAHQLGAEPWWTLATSRTASLCIIALLCVLLLLLGRAPSVSGTRAVLPLLAASAVGDTGGNLFFVLSRSETTLAISVVLSSLYPVSTAILARIVLHERLSPVAIAGVVLAVCGVVLIGIGSTVG
jgi:drug/metabolite transporter (DMT)-like permease